MEFTPENGRWPSPFNDISRPEVLRGRKIRIADCTLRDGEQQAGIVLNRKSKVAIAKALDALGVYEIESGTVASSEEDRKAIGEIVGLDLNAKSSVLCRGINGDIDMAADLDVWGVRLSFPISDIERKYKLKDIDEAEYIRRAIELAAYAKHKGLAVIFSPFDTTRANLELLRLLVTELSWNGVVDRLRIVDTTGCALPEAIRFIVENVRDCAPDLPLEVHCHNDFGLSCANTLAGIMAGADYVSSTINGIGERCGNAATEEVVMALEVLYGVNTGIEIRRFKEISELVAKLSRTAVHPNKAVVGENAFRHEAGMVVASVLKNPYTAEAYAPELVGQKRDILLGKKSGLVSIRYKAEALGVELNPELEAPLLDDVKRLAVRLGRCLTDDEFVGMVRDISAGGAGA